MEAQRTSWSRVLLPSLLSLLIGLAAGCAADSGISPPSVPWNQQLATEAAGAYHGQMKSLYDTAIKDPAFAGERSAYGEMLDSLRILQEESGQLHAQLKDGKSRDQTLHTWERIKEVSRDALESSDWEFLPADFSKSAQTALKATDQLEQLYGAF